MPDRGPNTPGEARANIARLKDLVRLKPDDVAMRRELGDSYRSLGRVTEAENEYRAALRHTPRDAAALCDFGRFLLECGRPKEAMAQADAAIAFNPFDAPSYTLRGIALAAQGRLDDAIAAFAQASLADPTDAAAPANMATALVTQGRFEQALAASTDAIRLAPTDMTIHLNHAIALLKAGRLAEGWAAYEWRHRKPGREKLPPSLMLPKLAHLGSVAGKTVVIYHEEGYGDTLQFFRYVKLLAEAGARIVLWMPEPLARLMRGQAGVAEVLTGDVGLPRFDYHCPIISLPHIFDIGLESVPADIPYILPDPALMKHWAGTLPASAGGRVGLVWSGEPRPYDPVALALDRRRSLPLRFLEPLLAVPGLSFVSLQTGAAARQAAAPVHDPMGGVSDFADTAAIIANLDLVISVDTAVAHLAGAMGRPVFLLDRYDNCWRWLSGRTDSPWYPTLRIFRQPRTGDWTPAIDAAAQALASFAAGEGNG